MTLWRPKAGTCTCGIRDTGLGGGEKGDQGRAHPKHKRGLGCGQGGDEESRRGTLDAVAQGWVAADGDASKRGGVTIFGKRSHGSPTRSRSFSNLPHSSELGD
jgi:hypothetical protein